MTNAVTTVASAEHHERGAQRPAGSPSGSPPRSSAAGGAARTGSRRGPHEQQHDGDGQPRARPASGGRDRRGTRARTRRSMTSVATPTRPSEIKADRRSMVPRWPRSSVKPRTSRRLPTIEPTSDALTISVRPSETAMIAMISSGALPKRRVEEAADPGTGVAGGVVRRLADQPGERDQRGGGEHEDGQLAEQRRPGRARRPPRRERARARPYGREPSPSRACSDSSNGSIGRPAARQPSNPSIRSVARVNPRSCNVAAARLVW